MAWTCPECGRQFARNQQSHECAPAMSLEEYLATGPPHERPVFEAVMHHVETLGPVHVEPVSVGVFFKHGGRRFAQLRPMQRWMALSFALRQPVSHPTITRKVIPYHGRYHHTANIARPEDIDDDIRNWLTEAYLTSDPDSSTQ